MSAFPAPVPQVPGAMTLNTPGVDGDENATAKQELAISPIFSACDTSVFVIGHKSCKAFPDKNNRTGKRR